MKIIRLGRSELQSSRLAYGCMRIVGDGSREDRNKGKRAVLAAASVSQFDLLQSVLSEPLLVNQVEINIHNIDALSNGVMDQCQQKGVTPQAWCPIAGVAYPAWGNTFSAEDEARILAEVNSQSEKYGAEDWIIALAWLLKHPATISPIIGSTSPTRIAAATSALDIGYSREDWYRLLEARNGSAVP